ncbi:MAG TPA: hypothetical protein VMN36_04165 [Verrucomicrobiales bacterium]|nr:hypothetical protein [Verrucomicrobiales bacterium]
MNAGAGISPLGPPGGGARRIVLGLVAGALAALSGCAGVELSRTLVDNRDVPGPESGVTVFRQGARIPVNPGMALQTDDSVQTGGRSTAILWFDGRHEIIMLPNTKVEIHSLWVEFGKILARIHGKFRIESESVVAGVEGTEFLLQVGGPDAMGVTVVEGKVRLTSKRTERSIVVNPFETGAISRAGVPAKRALTDRERRLIEAQLRQFDSTIQPPAPPPDLRDRLDRPSPFPRRPMRPNRPDRSDERSPDRTPDRPVKPPPDGSSGTPLR